MSLDFIKLLVQIIESYDLAIIVVLVIYIIVNELSVRELKHDRYRLLRQVTVKNGIIVTQEQRLRTLKHHAKNYLKTGTDLDKKLLERDTKENKS